MTACVQPVAASRPSQAASSAGRSKAAGTSVVASPSRQPRSERTPTLMPPSERTDAVSHAVVVFPLVPVMAITCILRAGSPANACARRACAQAVSGTRHSGVPKVGMIRSATIPATPRAIAWAACSWPSPPSSSRAMNRSPGRQASTVSWQPRATMSSQATNRARGKISESRTATLPTAALDDPRASRPPSPRTPSTMTASSLPCAACPRASPPGSSLTTARGALSVARIRGQPRDPSAFRRRPHRPPRLLIPPLLPRQWPIG